MLNLQNTQIAFANQSDTRLQKAYWLFKLMSSNVLVKIGQTAAQWSLKLNLPIKPLIRYTIFEQFCGGETIAECDKTIAQLNHYKVGAILDYSVEGNEQEEDFDLTTLETIRTIQKAKNDPRIPFSVFKITGLGPHGLLEKISQNQPLTPSEEAQWQKTRARVLKICQTAHDIDQSVFIDAEESWIQNAIDGLAMDMMARFNTQKPIVYNTIQLYRHDRLQYLKDTAQTAKQNNFLFAIKIVRGAYMERERHRATQNRYPSPIQPDKQATDTDFDAALLYCIENIKHIAVCAGSHNEQSNVRLTELMQQFDIEKNHPHIAFSQLYGMSDHISFNLSNEGYNVSKYLPYGPINAVIPYLIRRTQENTSVAGQMGRELSLLSKEVKRRKLVD